MKYISYVNKSKGRARFSIYEIKINKNPNGEEAWWADYDEGLIELHKLVLTNYKAKDYVTDPEYVRLRKEGSINLWPIRHAEGKDLCNSLSEAKHKVIKKVIR